MEQTTDLWEERESARESGMERVRLQAERRYRNAERIAIDKQAGLAELGDSATDAQQAEFDAAFSDFRLAAEYRNGVRAALWEMFRRADDEYVIEFQFGWGQYKPDTRSSRDGRCDQERLGALAMLLGLPQQTVYDALPADVDGRRRLFDSAEFYQRTLPSLGVTQISLGGGRPTMSEAHRLYGNCVVFWNDPFLDTNGVCALVDGCQWGPFDKRFNPVHKDYERRVYRVFVVEREQHPRRLLLDFEEDDGGRHDAGFRGRPNGDCAARAVSILLGLNYRELYKRFSAAARAAESEDEDEIPFAALRPIMEELGLFEAEMPDGRPMTLTEAHNHFGDCIAITDGGKHMVALMAGAVRDLWNPMGMNGWDPRYEDTRQRRQKTAQAVLVPRGLLL